MRSVIHAITPGDHYSPRTGSAIATVVHGLATAAATDSPPVAHSVVVKASTMHPRYESAPVIEYTHAPRPDRRELILDVVRGWEGVERRAVAAYYAPLVDVIGRQGPGVVLAHNAPIVPWLLRQSPHRVVLYAHNHLLRTYSRREADRVLGAAAAIVCVSESLADHTRSMLPRSLRDRIHVVGNGVDTVRFAPPPAAAARPERPAPDHPMRVVFVGRMIPDKGPDVLIRAAGLLGRDDIEYCIVGSRGFARGSPLSAYEQDLRRLAHRTRARIHFEPFVDRDTLPDLLGRSDVLVVPSRWAEPSGLTAAEGLATGLPVIASRTGGLPEVVGDVGILVPPNNPRALGASIEALADDPGERARRATASRLWALEHDWSWSWSHLRRVLEEL